MLYSFLKKRRDDMFGQFFRRIVRLFSLLVILMCEACSMKQQHLKKRVLPR
jgi:hypothetical protein